MSLAFAFAAGSFALVAADTRINGQDLDGTHVRLDEDVSPVEWAPGRRYAPPREQRKLRLTPSGWATATGDAILAEEALVHLRAGLGLADVPAALEEVRSDMLRVLAGSRDRCAILRVASVGEEAVLSSVALTNGAAIQADPASFLVAWPPEIPEDEAAVRNARLGDEIEEALTHGGIELYGALLAVVGRLFRQVAERDESVGPRVQVGLLQAGHPPKWRYGERKAFGIERRSLQFFLGLSTVSP